MREVAGYEVPAMRPSMWGMGVAWGCGSPGCVRVWSGRIFIHHQSQFSRFQQIINFLLPTREVSICVTAVLSTASVAVHVGIPFIQANDDHRQPLAVIPSWPRERRW